MAPIAVHANVKEDGDPLELLYALSDSCMYQLSANGWKVVSYVAMQCLRLYPERDFARQNPGLAALNNDLFKMGMHPRLPPTDDRPYRNVIGEFGEAQRFAVLSASINCVMACALRRDACGITGLA